MKHAFFCALAMASCLLAPPAHAQLQWLGPLPPATKPAATARPPAAPPRFARRRIDATDNPGKHKGLPLELIIKDNQAKVCQLSTRLTNVCAVIEAALPPGTTVQLWNLPDGSIALTYMRTPGVQGAPDADGTAARRFQAAFNGAARAVEARAVQTRARSTAHTLTAAVAVACSDEDCDGSAEGGDGGGGGSNGSNGGSGGSGDGDPPIPVVTVHGEPDPVGEIPTVVVTGHREDPDIPVLLPPRDPRDDLAGLTDPCVINPIMTVCIIGRRPPLPVDTPPLPTGNPPWFPQWMCNFADVFCTRGQIARNRPSDPPVDPSWPNKPRYMQCVKDASAKLEYCKSLTKHQPIDQVQQCVDQVETALDDCDLLYGPGQ